MGHFRVNPKDIFFILKEQLRERGLPADLSDHPRTRSHLRGDLPGWGGTQRLPRLIGRQKALQMILFSTTIDAAGALAIGLVDYLCKPEEFENRLDELAQRLAERPPVAVRCTLEAMSAGRYEGMDRGLDREAQGSTIVRQTEDRKEGFRAFLEKRKPTFIGR